MRLFGFDSSMRRKLMEEGNGTTLALSNCEVKKSSRGDQLVSIILRHSRS